LENALRNLGNSERYRGFEGSGRTDPGRLLDLKRLVISTQTVGLTNKLLLKQFGVSRQAVHIRFISGSGGCNSADYSSTGNGSLIATYTMYICPRLRIEGDFNRNPTDVTRLRDVGWNNSAMITEPKCRNLETLENLEVANKPLKL
jgi:hypothetical protein